MARLSITNIALIYTAAVITGSVYTGVDARRWLDPCGGTQILDEPSSEVRQQQFELFEEIQTTVDESSLLQLISDRALTLKRRVITLKNQYIIDRFRDTQIVADIEAMGLRLAGMPVIEDNTDETLAKITVRQTVHLTFEHLARISVFLNQARIGETMAVNERVTFHAAIGAIENDSDHGLYWLMCELHRAIVSWEEVLDPEVVTSVSNIKVKEVDNNSMRHTRDYLVLRDTERVLDHVSVEFAALVVTSRER